MTDKLETVKEALRNTIICIEEELGATEDLYAKCAAPMYAKDIQHFKEVIRDAKQALAELNSYMEARASEEMVERVAKALAKLTSDDIRDRPSLGGTLRPNPEWYIPQAKAAIKAMNNLEKEDE